VLGLTLVGHGGGLQHALFIKSALLPFVHLLYIVLYYDQNEATKCSSSPIIQLLSTPDPTL